MFSQVSVCPQGAVSAPLHAGIHTPWQVHPPCRYTPPGRYTPGQVHPWQVQPPGRYTPCRYTPSRYTPRRSACWDTVNKRAVRIPLECILGHWNVFLVESDVFASILRVDSGFRQSCHIYLKETCFMVLTSH